ncbi:TniQ family protein [Massilia sp. SR12]
MKYSQKKVSENFAANQAAQLAPIEGIVLAWQEGESFYSLLARNHQIRGAMAPWHTIKAFFGTASGGSLHEDHSELDVFVAKTEGVLGTADHILKTHTLFRYFRLFMSSSQRKQVESGRRSAKKMLNFPLALSLGGFRGVQPLKGCAACCLADMEKSGMPYWRLTHQYPGIWICPEHDLPLQLSAQEPANQTGFHWLTPAPEDFAPIHSHLTKSEFFEKFQWLSELIASLTLDCDAGAMRVAAERKRLISYAQSLRVLTPRGRLRSQRTDGIPELVASFTQFADTYRVCKEFHHLPVDPEPTYRLLARHLNGKSELCPSERIILTAWSVSLLGPAGATA